MKNVTNCLIVFREESKTGENSPLPDNLDRYAIVPIEDYEKHRDAVRRMNEGAEAEDDE